MADREKVIAALEKALAATKAVNGDFVILTVREGKQALEMLKEQESEWLEDSDPGQEYGTTWACRKCKYSIHERSVWNPYDSGYRYCPHCGAEMKVKLDA